jgi:ribosome recycling factor
MGMAEDVVDDLHKRISKTLDDLRRELAKVRTGRANPALLEGVRVDYYGQLSPLQNVANVTVADPRLIVVKPWEKAMIPVIEKAINAAGLGVNAQSDAEMVRVPIPPLTEERRREFVKVVKHKGEEHKIAIRNERRDAKELIEESVKEGDLTEDAGKKALEKVQIEVDNGVKKVDEIIGAKEKDLMQV